MDPPSETVIAGVALVWLAGTCALLALVFRKALADAWREPVLRASGIPKNRTYPIIFRHRLRREARFQKN